VATVNGLLKFFSTQPLAPQIARVNSRPYLAEHEAQRSSINRRIELQHEVSMARLAAAVPFKGCRPILNPPWLQVAYHELHEFLPKVHACKALVGQHGSLPAKSKYSSSRWAVNAKCCWLRGVALRLLAVACVATAQLHPSLLGIVELLLVSDASTFVRMRSTTDAPTKCKDFFVRRIT
jgi:hypothetical protein